MIDAVTFSSSYNAFWSEATPMLEHFVRRLNIEYQHRFAIPMADTKTERRAVLAEFAYSVFAERLADPLNLKSDQVRVDLAWNETKRRLLPFLGQGVDLEKPLDAKELDDVAELVKRLISFFKGEHQPRIVRPLFKGCGFIDASEGDILTESTLFEVKTVDRSFRSADVRQLLTYAALNASSRESTISSVGLVNPRRGVAFEMPLDRLCLDISGRSPEELFSVVVQVFSSGEISR